MNDAGDSENPWRATKLRLLMSAVTIACVVTAFLFVFLVMLPALGIRSDTGVSPIKEPVSAAFLVASVLVPFSAIIYGGAILGAWIARRFFRLDEIESEFLWQLWIPGTRAANTRLFRYLFSRRADV